MEARELTFKGESDPKLYACGKCGKAYSPKVYACRDDMAHTAARRAAEECCKPRFCDCGTELDSAWSSCRPCRERKMLAKAEVIEASDYNGPVSAECGGDWGGGFSSDLAAMIKACHDAEEPVPAYCHPCTERSLKIDPANVLENATDDMHEEAFNQIVDADELTAFISAWNEKQTCVTYYEDRSRVIIIDQVAFDDIMRAPAAETPTGATNDHR